MQPDDEEIEEEFEVEEAETKSTPRPASKLDLEEPITNTSQNEDDDDNDDEDVDDVILTFFLSNFQPFGSKLILFFFKFRLRRIQNQFLKMVHGSENRAKIKQNKKEIKQ